MNVLIIGSGGREHALCWKMKSSPSVDKIYCAPGNAGIASVAECLPIKVDELEKLAEFAANNNIALTVVGPEAPLCAGVVDLFKARGLAIFGPDRFASQLEGSKDFAKQFMLRHNIPTARAAAFTEVEPAIQYTHDEFAAGRPVVVKADGLAAGKGVLVAESAEEAAAFIRTCFEGAFGSAGCKVLLEERLEGEEASILALTDTRIILPLVSSQDHKRIFDNDRGPNTGGMGAYSPAPVVTPEVMRRIEGEILHPFLLGVQQEKLDFHGVIFVGVMVTPQGPKVLEFNVRFGDPETQPVMRRFEGDLFETMLHTAQETLRPEDLRWSEQPAVSVVIAAGGYPGEYRSGDPISGLEEAAQSGAVVFHAGTKFHNGQIVSAGGRVLGVSARGATVREAVDNAYRAVDAIHFADCFARRDIAHRALVREREKKS